MDIFERMTNEGVVDMRTDVEYQTTARAEMERSMNISQRACLAESPYSEEVRHLLDELFEGRLPKTSRILPPFHIDRAKCMEIGENVFINHGLTCMSSGGITIEDGVMLGPDVALLTTNHDLDDIQVLKFKRITLKEKCWIGARAIILPGVTIGEGAVVAAGAVVTKNVEPKTVVAGNPARVIKKIET